MKDKKTVLLGVSGGISAYKTVYVASGLKKKGYDVHVVMTDNAAKFVTPLTFETMSGNKVVTDVFDPANETPTEHITLGQSADLAMIAPATANTIAKLAHGIADNMLTTTMLACTCPKIIAPAMNTAMYENPVTQDNIKTLIHYGWEVIEPDTGRLACGAVGKGKLVTPERLLEACIHTAAHEKDMTGMKVLVTAGPTREALDPVRFLTNHSSGKMGYAIAKAAARRGADVTLVSGKVDLPKPAYINVVDIVSAQDMYDAVMANFESADIVIKAAAVADYRPATVADNKIKKSDDDLSIPLERTKDILKTLGENKKDGQFLCGFSMETENMIENSKGKLIKKGLDMIAANNVKVEGAGFGTDTNILTLITKDDQKELPIMSKDEAADALLDAILKARA